MVEVSSYTDSGDLTAASKGNDIHACLSFRHLVDEWRGRTEIGNMRALFWVHLILTRSYNRNQSQTSITETFSPTQAEIELILAG
jgi:hypothetical protein